MQIFGATYMVVAPEHPLLTALTVDGQRAEVEAYVAAAAAKSDLERTDLAKEKSGVQTGERSAAIMFWRQGLTRLRFIIAQSSPQQQAPFGVAKDGQAVWLHMAE